MIRLSLLTAAARLLGFSITFHARFVPENPNPNQTRGRTHWVTDVLAEAKATWDNLTSGKAPLKEKVNGTLTLIVEASIAIHDHTAAVATQQSDSLELPLAIPSGVPDEAPVVAAATAAEEAEDADPKGIIGGGAVGGHDPGAEAPAGTDESLGARSKVSLEDIGLK